VVLTPLGAVAGSSQLEILGRVALAMALGALVGLERELAGKPAGLRTNMFVAGASALFVSLGEVVIAETVPGPLADAIRADPTRTLEAVVTGVSFLGAGTIIRQRAARDVEGLTTAASILLCAGLGAAVAGGMVVLACGVALLALAVLLGLGALGHRIRGDGPEDPGEGKEEDR